MDWRERFAAYVHARLPAAETVRVTGVGSMPAGASNDTVALDLEVACDGVMSTLPLVLRPQRRDGILAPYDVGRQYRVLRALKRTAVPVPTVAWYEPDDATLGAPFFVMHRLQCETLPLFWYGDTSVRLPAAAAALAAVHAVDWRKAGMAFLMEKDPDAPLPSPIACELAAWRVKGRRLGLAEDEAVAAIEAYLLRSEPADARHALVHGDPNPGNYLFRGPDVVAVVDWELAAIGDPRSDLGFYAGLLAVFGGASTTGGRTVLSDAYEGVTGQRLTSLEYYEAFGLYRMLVVMAGWGSRGFYGNDPIVHRLDALLGPGWRRG